MKKQLHFFGLRTAWLLAASLFALFAAPPVPASSAPLIVLDPAANISDVYAFVNVGNAQKNLVVALSVYPHEEPGVGANKYNFDPNVLYEIHVALGKDFAEGKPSISYQFQFKTRFKNKNTILQSFLGVINNIDDAGQNLTQTYTVTKIEHRRGDRSTVLGTGLVPPNNQGNVTPFYNEGDNGENPARTGVSTDAELDRYTRQGVTNLSLGYVSFAGQREDGFYADMQSLFDLLQLRSPGKDSHGGFNHHFMALVIPVSEVGGDQQIVGVYATTSRRQLTKLSDDSNRTDAKWVQIDRRGNPLFSEFFIPVGDQDSFSRSYPKDDVDNVRKYALNPELAKLINVLIFGGSVVAIENNRTDLASIFIPDLLKVDLTTGAAHLAGNGFGHPTNPDDSGYSRLSFFGFDLLTSTVQDPFSSGGLIPGGWPNGRRFGDDVVDILGSLLLSDLRGPLVIRAVDGVNGVSGNEAGYNKVFPYEAAPHNGRNHAHP